jgi:hypothetical protein
MYTGEGQIISSATGINNQREFVKDQLLQIKKKCIDTKMPFPRYVTVDDCCQSRHMVHEVFPEATVTQDIRHLVSRIIEQCSKSSDLYTQFAKNAHKAITGDKKIIRSRNGKVLN